MLENICSQAMLEGKKIDLKGCVYGEPHSPGSAPTNKPYIYYYFLAGLVKSRRLKYIFEIGTHFGGSIMSMSKGIHSADIMESKLLTVDVTYKNEDGFKKFAYIKRITGNALSGGVIKEVTGFYDKPVDLMFIDSDHCYEHVRSCIDIYANKLKPKYIVLDDIFLNESMERLWLELINEFGPNVLDLSEITVRGRSPNGTSVGFGIIDWQNAIR